MKNDWIRKYWIECVALGAEECGALLTPEQIECIADSVMGGVENYGMASGNDVATANLHAVKEREKDDLRKQVQRERAKVPCKICDGTGQIITQGPYHSSQSRCFKCEGEGRHDP